MTGASPILISGIDSGNPPNPFGKTGDPIFGSAATIPPFESHLFLDEWDKDIRCKWKEFFQTQAETGVIHSLLDSDIPPAPRKEYQKPFFWDYCYFDDLGVAQDCLPIEGWLLRFAMEEKDGRTLECR